MRGKGFYYRLICKGGRITPAYAGKSIVMFNSSAVQKDHPRLCGEKQFGCHFLKTEDGITPAYAGKSFLDCVK